MDPVRQAKLLQFGAIVLVCGAAVAIAAFSGNTIGPIILLAGALSAVAYRVIRSPSHQTVAARIATVTSNLEALNSRVSTIDRALTQHTADDCPAMRETQVTELEGELARVNAELAVVKLEHADRLEEAQLTRDPVSPSVPPALLDDRAGIRIRREELDLKVSKRSPADFAAEAEVEWIYDAEHDDPACNTNRFDLQPRESVLEWILSQRVWRHHHDVPELRNSGDLYQAYVERVDAMLDMCRNALAAAGLDDLTELSAVDLASSEGFVATHFLERGLSSIDCLELSRGGIERHLALLALTGARAPRIGRIDLELANWAAAVPRYDLVFALGIVYHLENPALFARNVYEITNQVALVESDTPAFSENKRFRGNGVIYLHRDQVRVDSGETRYLTEMRPDRVALAQLFLAAGFEEVEFIEASPRSKYFVSGEKSLMLCFKEARNQR